MLQKGFDKKCVFDCILWGRIASHLQQQLWVCLGYLKGALFCQLVKFRSDCSQLPFPSHNRKAQGRVGLRRTDTSQQAGRPPNVSVGSGWSFLCMWSIDGSVFMSDLCISCHGDDGISHHGKQSCSSFQPELQTIIANPDFCEQVSKLWWWIS